MRILVANEAMGEGGGVDSYLRSVLPGLGQRGHDIGFLHYNRRADNGPWPASLVSRTFGVLDAGIDRVVSALETWMPDVCYSHNMQPLEVDRALLARWPVVKMMHGYFGTCIGGQKSFAWPRPRPCARVFGPACLGFYFPRRCGQLRVAKMLEQYRWAKAQRALFKRYVAVIVASDHMREEYARNGIAARLHVVPLFAPECTADADAPQADPQRGWRVLFLGRMTKLKGGDLLIRAAAKLGRDVELVMAGDGPQRAAWEQLARDLGVRATFPGWVDPAERDRLLREASVLALPSVWPEPFGLVGLEAARFGVPAVAFDVGGVRQWLQDGHNGFLASAHPPTAESFASALDEAVGRSGDARARAAAREVARVMTVTVHLDRLEAILRDAALSRRT
jgi:glycosyltransferase involved in cell wall biosynthesis